MSSSEMVHYADFWPEFLRVVSADMAGLSSTADHSRWINQWFAILDQKAMESRYPYGCPADSGEFIGICCYILTSVNDLSVVGPTFSDSYHEEEWRGLNEDYPQRWHGDDENSSFCWLHYLSLAQVRQIGIAANGKQALDRDKDYPRWVSRTFMAKKQMLWIHSAEIQSSSRHGRVVVSPSTEAWIAVGCGSGWNPADPDNQLAPEKIDGWDSSPKTMDPLLKIEVSRDAEQLPTELEALLPYWQLLHSLL